MTVETTDRENLAEKVFLLEKWQAKAVQTISQLEGERDEARAEVEAARQEIARLGAVADDLTAQRDEAQSNLRCQLIEGLDTPVGGCTKCAEMRASLEAAEASIDSLRASLHAREAELTALKARRDEWKKDLHDVLTERDKVVRERNETQHQLNICREDLATADRTVRVTKAALDAAIEAV